MILFGLLQKGVVKVVNRKPLKLKKLNIDKATTKLRPYEKTFLECIKKDGGFSKKRSSKFIVDFIKKTNRRIKGFSRKETTKYYKEIAADAWKMVQQADTPEVAGQAFGEHGQWLLMEKKFDDRFTKTIRHQTIYLPHWWGGHGGFAHSPSSGPSMSIPDFANSMTDSISGFSNGLVSDISDFTSGVTGKTNPPPVSTSSGGGGGSGCACACACAGCACACAGGGR
jgi:hypothetical protein